MIDPETGKRKKIDRSKPQAQVGGSGRGVASTGMTSVQASSDGQSLIQGLLSQGRLSKDTKVQGNRITLRQDDYKKILDVLGNERFQTLFKKVGSIAEGIAQGVAEGSKDLEPLIRKTFNTLVYAHQTGVRTLPPAEMADDQNLVDFMEEWLPKELSQVSGDDWNEFADEVFHRFFNIYGKRGVIHHYDLKGKWQGMSGEPDLAEGSLNEFAPGNGGDDEDWRDDPYSHIMSYIAQHEDWNDRYGEDEVDSTVSDMITMGSLENAEDLEDAVFLVGDVLEKNNPDEAPDWSEGVAEGSRKNTGEPKGREELYQYHLDAAKISKGKAKEHHLQQAEKYKKQGVQSEGVAENAEQLDAGDDVVITGRNNVYQGKTGYIVGFGQDKRFVIVQLYNHGRHSFDSSDVSRNEYADSEEEHDEWGDLEEGLRDPKDNPCWTGYHPVGTKKKGGRTVPNCVPKKK